MSVPRPTAVLAQPPILQSPSEPTQKSSLNADATPGKADSWPSELPYYANYAYAANEIYMAKYALPSNPAEVQRGIESGRFPTLRNLARLQRQLGEAPRSPDARDAPPFPPRRTKEELLRPQEFAEKDAFARSVTPRPSDDWEQLAQQLFRLCRSDLDRVRAAFCFVCTERQLAETAGETPAFRAIRLRTQHDIFENLLLAGGVPHKKIYGYKKGVGYESGLLAEMGGFWFACYVEGEWRFVDPHWGSQSVSNYDSGKFGAINDQGRVGSATERSGQNVFHCNEFWFLTDPDKLIVTHCPPEDLLKWQLLARPLTIWEYQLMPKYFNGSSGEMEYYQIDPISYPRNVVIVARPGPVEIMLREVAPGVPYKYTAKLAIHKKDINTESKAAILTASQQKTCISKEIRVSQDTVKFIFDPPCAGQFALTILVWRLMNDSNLAGSEFAIYTVHCPQTWDSVGAGVFPEGPLAEFGVGRDLRVAGLTSNAAGEVKAADGEAELVVAPLEDADSRLRKITCIAMGPDNQPLPTGSVLVWQDERRNAFLFLAPDSGYYALVLFEAGRPVGQFLVDASSEAKDSGCFPLPDWDRVGGIGFAATSVTSGRGGGGRRLTPLSHPTPYVRTEEAELAMRLGFEGDANGSGVDGGIELKAELLTVRAGGGAEAAGNFALASGFQGDGGGYDVRCRFPRAGHYLLRLLVRDGGSGDWQPYFTYFVRAVGHVDGSAAEFPGLTSAWRYGGALLEPLERTLPLDRPTPVRLRLADPTVIAVAVVVGWTGRRVPLNRDPNDPTVWGGLVSVGVFDRSCDNNDKNGDGKRKEGIEGEVYGNELSKVITDDVTVVAQAESGLEVEIANFTIESKGTFEAKVAAMREAATLNKQRQSAEATRQLKQENRRRRDQGLEPLMVSSAHIFEAAKVEADAAAKATAAAQVAARAQAKAEADAKVAAKSAAVVKAQTKLLIAQMDAALLDRDLTGVRKAIVALEPFSSKLRFRDAKKLDEAKLTLTALQHRKGLRDALSEAKRTRNTQRLRALLHSLEVAEPQLPETQLAIFKEDLRLAKAEIERDDRLKRKPEHKLDMNPNSLSELRQYSRPVESVHRTVQALLLLLGFYEKRTRKWLRCQQLLKSITKTLADFDPHKVHPSIAARSRQILDGIDKREIALQSAAAFAFYEWAVQITQSIKEAASKTFIPATIKQQMRILDVTREEDAMLDFEDEGIRRSMSVIIR